MKSKLLIKLSAVLCITSILWGVSSISALAITNDTEPNNSWTQAQYLGALTGLNYASGTLDPYNEDEKRADREDWYKVSSSSGDFGFIRLTSSIKGADFDMEVYEGSGTGAPVYVANKIGDDLIRINEDSKSDYYIKVIAKPGAKADPYTSYTLTTGNRIGSRSVEKSFSPTSISCPGNNVYSDITSMNLSNDLSIPNSAMIKSITVEGQGVSTGNTFAEIKSSKLGWTKTRLSSNSANFIGYKYSDQIKVKDKWELKYVSSALAKTKWSNLKASISYDYDKTEDWD